jgi:hypothetical protein
MNKLALAGAISIALASSWCAIAQTSTPAPKQAAPTAAPAAKQAPAAPASNQAVAPAPKAAAPITTAAPPAAEPGKPAKRAARRAPSHADARVCLEFQTNLQVIKCAEKYRWAS